MRLNRVINKISYVYALGDPDSGEVRYVGVSTNPKLRLKKHYSERGDEQKHTWLQTLKQNGKEPYLLILESCKTELEARRVCEQKWIAEFNKEGALFNRIYPGCSRA